MITAFTWAALLLLHRTQVVDVQSIATRPRNTAALNNTKVTLQCVFSTTTNYAKWREYITGTGTGQVPISGGVSINPSHPRADRYSIDANDAAGKYNLQIKALAPDDSGYYACIGDQLENSRYGAYVVYLGPRTCGVTQGGTVVTNKIVVENDDFTLTCQRDYRSFTGWPPIMEWSGPTPIGIDRNITTTTNIRYEVDLQAKESMDGNMYRCKTSFTSPPSFKSPDEGFQDDTTTPTISEADCAATIQVHWPAKNISRSPEKNVYYTGDTVTCSASANPLPHSYSWNKQGGNGPTGSATATLLITEDMIGDSQYECIVTNKVKGIDTNNSHNFTFTVQMRLTTVVNTILRSTSHPSRKSPMTTPEICHCPTEACSCSPTVESHPCSCGPGFVPGLFSGLFLGIVITLVILVFTWFLRHKMQEGYKKEKKSTSIIHQNTNPASARNIRSAEYEDVTELSLSVEAGVENSAYQQLQRRDTGEKEYAKLQPVYQNTSTSSQ